MGERVPCLVGIQDRFGFEGNSQSKRPFEVCELIHLDPQFFYDLYDLTCNTDILKVIWNFIKPWLRLGSYLAQKTGGTGSVGAASVHATRLGSTEAPDGQSTWRSTAPKGRLIQGLYFNQYMVFPVPFSENPEVYLDTKWRLCFHTLGRECIYTYLVDLTELCDVCFGGVAFCHPLNPLELKQSNGFKRPSISSLFRLKDI